MLYGALGYVGKKELFIVVFCIHILIYEMSQFRIIYAMEKFSS